jgi:hypothetical protein
MRTAIRGGMAAVVFVAGLLAVSTGSTTAAMAPRFCQTGTAEAAFAARIGSGATSQPRGVVLLTSEPKTAPGKPIYARLANFGNKRAIYSREFAIERRSEGGWMLDAASPKGPWVKVAGILKAGSAGRCYRFDVPPAQPLGRYRFSTKINGAAINDAPQRRTAVFLVG